MPVTVSSRSAFAACEQLAGSHYENFSVLSWFLPRALRPHFSSIYAFCRHTDDLGDEGIATPEVRLAHLDAWEAGLRRCFCPNQRPEHPYLIALQETIQTYDLPAEPFLRLIEANRMDQRQHRYPTYADVLHYCEYSANPVGQLVLMLYGYRDAERLHCSDAICTALQLTNFWQDLWLDYHERERIYVPLEDMTRFGVTEPELARGEVTPAVRALLAFEVQRARALFYDGLPLLKLLPALPCRAVALFALGGMEILATIERAGFDVFAQRPTLSRHRKAALMARVLLFPPKAKKY
jgi:squalene synthase HpnC